MYVFITVDVGPVYKSLSVTMSNPNINVIFITFDVGPMCKSLSVTMSKSDVNVCIYYCRCWPHVQLTCEKFWG